MRRGGGDGRAETRQLQEPDCRDIGRFRDQNLGSKGFGEKAAEVAAPRKTSINRDLCARCDSVERVDQFSGPKGDSLDHRAAEIGARRRKVHADPETARRAVPVRASKTRLRGREHDALARRRGTLEGVELLKRIEQSDAS